MIRISAVLACCVVTSGCVSIGPYPDQWAEKARVESGACPLIDGDYQNEGESFGKTRRGSKRSTTSLVQVLAEGFSMESDRMNPSIDGPQTEQLAESPATEPLTDIPPDPHEKVSLRLVGNTLKVTATGTDGSTASFERPVELECRDSMLLVESDWSTTLNDEEMPTSVFLHMLEREAWKLGRAEDGSLLLHVSYAMSVMVLEWPIFPALASGWIRFSAVAPASLVAGFSATAE